MVVYLRFPYRVRTVVEPTCYAVREVGSLMAYLERCICHIISLIAYEALLQQVL